MFAQPKSRSWGGARPGAGRPADPGSRRATRARRQAANAASDEFASRVAFACDTARAIARQNVIDWQDPAWDSPEVYARAIQITLNDVVSLLDALVAGDSGPFET